MQHCRQNITDTVLVETKLRGATLNCIRALLFPEFARFKKTSGVVSAMSIADSFQREWALGRKTGVFLTRSTLRSKNTNARTNWALSRSWK